MAYSYAETTSLGLTATVAVPFKYLKQSHVSVTLDGVLVDAATYEWTDASNITLGSIPASGVAIKVSRSTPVTELETIFSSPEVLSDRDLNLVMKQLLFVVQESFDVGATTAEELTTLTTYISDSLTSMAASVAAAADSATAAGTSETNAGTSASSASSYATLASQWASLTGSLVASLDYSAKEWAVGVTTRGAASGGSAKDWATYTAGTVDNADYSAKYWSQQAAAYAASLSNPWIFADAWDPTSGVFPGGGTASKGWVYVASADGQVETSPGSGVYVQFSSGDQIIALVNNASTTIFAANWVKGQGQITSGEIVAALGYTPVTNARTVSAGGIASGGGALSGDITITVTKATGAEVTTGTDDTKAVTPKALSDAGIGPAPFTKSYTSTNQTPTQGGLVTLAHGLGAMPTLVQARIVITTAIGPYALNDEIIIDNNFSSNVQGYGRGVSMKIDATNIYVRFGGTDATMDLVNPSDGSVGSINYANFKLVVRAWA